MYSNNIALDFAKYGPDSCQVVILLISAEKKSLTNSFFTFRDSKQNVELRKHGF